ncbi:MAG: metallophosphoesterase, partial [Lentisphaeria bacterium]|nr:metallophosphoesterase [Lentisphaeria bacterium]
QAEGMRVAVLADLHADRVTRAPRIRRIVEQTNSLRPDLTVILGDLVDGTVEQRSGELLPLRELHAKYGVYAVPGNHEYYSGYVHWRKFFTAQGLRMLENSQVRLPAGIYLAGVTDPAAQSFGEAVPDLKKALHGIPRDSFILLLAHRPVHAENAAQDGISLQLSGHTHGGMIRGLDWIVSRFNGGFVSGLYDVGGMKLYVSNGTGIWNGFPVRLGRDSEITLITLKSG